MAYVADGNGGWVVVDVSNVSAPVIRGTFGAVALAGYFNEVVVQNGLAYVAGASAGLVVVDVSNASAPVMVGQMSMAQMGGTGTSVGLCVFGSVVYLTNVDRGVAVVDVTVPSVPVLRNTLLTPGSARRVVKDGNWLWVGDSMATIATLYLAE
jgi:hypothetical protein